MTRFYKGVRGKAEKDIATLKPEIII